MINPSINVRTVYFFVVFILFVTGNIYAQQLVQSYTENASVGSQFGFSTAGAGDVNNDGYQDIIVGAYQYPSTKGRAYIYFGGNVTVDNTADVTFTGETNFDFFGYAVAGAGDVNNDGYDDIIVGAYGRNTNKGKAYIYFGGNPMNNVADITLDGAATDYALGISVSGAGDLNKDGFDDVIIGATGYPSGDFTGRAYILFGGNPMNNSIDVTLTGENVNDMLGFSVAAAGDVNNDTYDDVIVGAKGYSSNKGRAYIYFGGSSMDNTADVTITGASNSDNLGAAVSGAGDVNKDGFSDVIVGAYGYTTNTGRAYIFLGGSSMDNTADVTFTGEATGNFFGTAVSGAGDFNHDTYADVIVGASSYSSSTGRAYVYYGGSSMNNTADVTITGEGTSNKFGNSVSGAGDVNNDLYSDVVIGAYQRNSSDGKAYLYSDNAASLPVELTSFSAKLNGSRVELYWQTATEINNYGFEVQKQVLSTEYGVLSQSQWEKIGFVKGKENSNSVKEYSFTDNNFSVGKYYYRLKQIDNDGKYEYSQTLEISFMMPGIFELEQNYPNPFNPITNFRFQNANFGLVTLKIFDVLGKEVATLINEEKEPGSYEVEFNASGLSSGVYYYTLTSGSFNEVKKLLLLK